MQLQRQTQVLQGYTSNLTHCKRSRSSISINLSDKQESNSCNLGKSFDVLRSQTTLFASAFQALMPPLAVPMSSYCQEKWVIKWNVLNMFFQRSNAVKNDITKKKSNIDITYQAVRSAFPRKSTDFRPTVYSGIFGWWCWGIICPDSF